MKHLRPMQNVVSTIMLLSVGIWIGPTLGEHLSIVAFVLIPACALTLLCLHHYGQMSRRSNDQSEACDEI